LRIVKAIGAGIAISVSFFYLGCGSIQVAEASHSTGTAPLTIATKQLPSAIIGTPYVAVLDATGGTPGYTWSVEGGQLPSGMSLASTTGIISGMPTVSGNFSISLAAHDSSSPAQVKSSALTIAIAVPSLKIAVSTLAPAAIGTPYSATLQASGGTAPYSWSVTSGALPAGLSLASSSGVISGTPTTSGTVRFTATVRDSERPAQSSSTSMSITVAAVPLKITTVAMASAASGAAYSQTLQVSGGTPAYKWAISSGSLPAGLTLASTGTISGTPTANGVANFTAAVTDHSNPIQITTAPFVITVAGAPLSIATPALGSATVGTTYSQSLRAIGGSAPYSWSITSGSLPAGLTLTPSTGAISGVPTTSGTSTFIATVADSGSPRQSLSVSSRIVVAPTPVSIVASALPSIIVGGAYSQTLRATGGTAPYSWSITSGSLPSGLALTSTGMISGTATTSGTSNFTATVTDSSSPAQTASAAKSVIIKATTLTVVPPSLPSVTVGTPYSKALNATGGVGPYVWSITAGRLPQGLNLAPNAGTISGVPTASGVSNFTATVTDNGSPAQSAPAVAAIVVAPTLLAITSSALTSTTVGVSYSQSMQASGGSAPYTWTKTSGALPAGLSLSQSTGLISGVPTASGKFTFTATVTDSSSPAQLTSATNTISVAPGSAPIAPPVLSITTGSLPSDTVGTSYTQTLQATGGTSPYSWQIASGKLPAGLSLSPNGTISGLPTSGSASTFTVSVTDSGSPAQTQSAGLTIGAASTSPLTITSSALAPGTSGTNYSQALSASGGTPAYTWSISSGSLPSGLTLAGTTGVISGSPTASGTSTFTVSVHDNSSPVQTQSTTSSITVTASQQSNGPGHTWYVDAAIGGTRYSTNVPAGLCDGTADAPPVGTTPNQHCAFKDARMLYQDGSYVSLPGSSFPAWGWVGSGGDTYIIMGSVASGIAYPIGWNTVSNYCDTTGCWGVAGEPQSSGMLTPPSGTSSAHTKLYGGCMLSNTCNAKDVTTLTELFGSWGPDNVMSLYGTNYVDVAGFSITDHSNCGFATDYIPCKTNGITQSSFAKNGIQLFNTTTNTTLNHLRIHGLGSFGLYGAVGDGFVATDLVLVGNASGGWNADDNSGQTGTGHTTISNFDISWNGCVEEYPIVDPLPYFSCTDQSYGGYGDGFGTATTNSPPPGWQVHFDQGTVSYNTQDGLDALHIGGVGSTTAYTRVLAFANEGNQLKVGGSTATIQNSAIVGNCEALTSGTPIPGRPFPTHDMLGAACRAGNTAVVIETTPGDPTYFQNNTCYSAGAICLEVEYATQDLGPTNTLQYNNNVFVGFFNSGAGSYPTPIYGMNGLAMLTDNPGAGFTNNAYLNPRANWTCPGNSETKARCGDPGLVDETYHIYGSGNMAPASSSSAVVGGGVAIPSINLDYTGYVRPDPPAIGAYEYPQ
jgi:Putative Ig domain